MASPSLGDHEEPRESKLLCVVCARFLSCLFLEIFESLVLKWNVEILAVFQKMPLVYQPALTGFLH